MINEEGGIDPEQFRMEAMFDRMDAIGKGVPRPDHPVRPVPQPQVRPAHAGGVLPAVRLPEQRPRGRARRLHARRADEGRPSSAGRSARSRTSLKHRDARLGRADGRVGETVARRPADVDGRRGRDVDDNSTGGQQYLPQKDGSILAQGYAPTKFTRADARRQDRPEDDHRVPARTAQRPEPAAAAGRAGRSRGPCALTEFSVEAAPAERAGQAAEGEVRRRPRPTSTTAERDAGAELRRQERARSASPARSRSPSTARTRPPGASTPARAAATSPRKAVFVAREADRVPDGGDADVQPEAEPRRLEQRRPQNNNLGRFRLSRHRRAETPSPTRCRRASATSSRSRPSSGPPAQVDAVFSYWRTTVPEWKDANDADRGALEAAPGRRRRSSCSQARDEPRDDAPAEARRLPQAGRSGRRRRAGVPAPAAAGRRRRTA